jgi:predicted DNA-binding protein (MmcQ/YjbR family)
MPDDAISRLREICLAFPEATERETWGNQTFRVREKIFAMAGHNEGHWRMQCKGKPGQLAALVEARPDRFYVAPDVGPKGWLGIDLGNGVDWDEVGDFVEESYRMTAPKRLVATLDTE